MALKGSSQARKLEQALKALEAADEVLAKIDDLENDARFFIGNTDFNVLVECRKQIQAAIKVGRHHGTLPESDF